MQRIDSHQHFWTLSRNDYHWLSPELEVLYRDYLVEDIVPLLRQAKIEKTILVQAAQSIEETEFLLNIASQHDFVAGVVGWIDMLHVDAVEQLNRLCRFAKFKGIRPMLQILDEPDWILNPKLTPVFNALIANNLCFEALIKPVHLPFLTQLLQRYPALKVVIDHAAKPDIASGETTQWLSDLRAIAQNYPIFCKLSGLLTEAQNNATYDDIEPYMQHIVDCFGSQRILFGSDWPVVNLAADYMTWLNYVERFLQRFNQTQQQAIWYENANIFYQLNLPPQAKDDPCND